MTANRGAGYRTFWVLWGVAALTGLVIVAFFFIGLSDGSVSSFNMGLWMGILLILGITLFGSYRLRMAGSNAWAFALVLVVAVPGLLFGFFLLVVIFSGTPWN
jgi:hypothetical protein